MAWAECAAEWWVEVEAPEEAVDAVLEVKVAGDRVTEAATAEVTVKVATAVGTMVMEDTITTAAVTAVTAVVTITADMVVIILCLFVLFI